MIAVDASALTAVLPDEPEAAAGAEALATSGRIVISAATVAEALIVSERRGIGAEMAGLVDEFQPEIATVSLTRILHEGGDLGTWGVGLV